jgi:hypothetical protein
MESKFTVSNVLRTSWKALTSQIWILTGLLIGYILLTFIIGVILSPVLSSSWGGKLILNLISLAISLIFGLGYFKNLFQTLDGDEPRFSAYGQQARKIGVYFVSGSLYGILIYGVIAILWVPYFYLLHSYSFVKDVFVGFNSVPVIPEGSGAALSLVILGALVLLLPAIYISLRFMFFQFFIVEEDAGIISSLSKSWKITKGQVWPLFLVGIVSMGLVIVGMALFFIGLLVALPLIALMFCCIFRKLK